MMGEPKTFASLSSGLLARKGAARPAMRPQGFGQIGATLEDLGWNDMGFEPPRPAISVVRDIDHDAFGDEIDEGAPRPSLAGLTPISPVHTQHAELAERFAGYDVEAGEEDEYDATAEPFSGEVAPMPVVRAAPPIVRAAPPVARRPIAPRAAPGSKAKAAFTLRLDPGRHLRLRLACAVTGRSAQMLVTDALDSMLEAMPELDGMAERAPPLRKAS